MVLTMECVAYIRVSTDEQVQGTSLDMQQKACVDFAKASGWTVPKENIFRDEGESAKAMNRPQLLAMLEFCRKNKGKISDFHLRSEEHTSELQSHSNWKTIASSGLGL